MTYVFVPSRGFLFFYNIKEHMMDLLRFLFSSPHGDFSFSIILTAVNTIEQLGFRPLTGISLFLLWQWLLHRFRLSGFRPLTGISLFLFGLVKTLVRNTELFSSPHGDFSFSIGSTVWRWWLHRTVFVPSRGFLFFYEELGEMYKLEQVKFSSPHGDFSFSI